MDDLFWNKIKHFTKNENWGDWHKVHPRLIIALDKLRELVGKPIVIHCAYAESGHKKNSQHYLGKAADIHIVGMNVVDQYLAAEKLGLFRGIGIYPYWNNKGLHVDIRNKPARWGRNAAGSYVALDSKFIHECLNCG